MSDQLLPKTELETVNTMLVGAKDDLTRLKIQERYMQRRVLKDKGLLKTLGSIQTNIKDTLEFIEFLEEVQGELTKV